MKIGKKSQPKLSKNYIWVAVSLFLFCLGFAWGNDDVLVLKVLDTAENLWGNLTSTSSNSSGLPQLVIDMPFENYDQLLQQRNSALDSGIFIASESDFLNADIRLAGETVPVRLRLQQGAATALGDDDKWGFDVRTRRDAQLLGMSRFFLSDPAEHNWLDEWAFTESLRREGIIAPRYQFVRLVFNGDDRGIYALQEGFSPALLAAQPRPVGVIVKFDTTKLWESAVHIGSDSAAQANPITNLTADSYRLFEVDALRDNAISEDEDLKEQRDAALTSLQSLQDGSLPAREVFDVGRYGTFLALVDLWGATDAIRLTNLRFYYHPRTERLEPIGFSGSPQLNDESQRIPIRATYGDAQLQAAYVAAAERLTQPDYLARLQADLAAEWRSLAAVVGAEADLTPPWEALAQRQQLLHRSLNPAEPVLANLGPQSLSMEGIIQVEVANIVNLPIELVGFDIDGELFLPAELSWWQNRPASAQTTPIILSSFTETESVPQFARIQIPLTAIIAANSEIDFNQQITISAVTRLVGQEETKLTELRDER